VVLKQATSHSFQSTSGHSNSFQWKGSPPQGHEDPFAAVRKIPERRSSGAPRAARVYHTEHPLSLHDKRLASLTRAGDSVTSNRSVLRFGLVQGALENWVKKHEDPVWWHMHDKICTPGFCALGDGGKNKQVRRPVNRTWDQEQSSSQHIHFRLQLCCHAARVDFATLSGSIYLMELQQLFHTGAVLIW